MINKIPILNHSSKQKQLFVSCEIRTHAHRSGLRPERSALDHSAKLTFYKNWQVKVVILQDCNTISSDNVLKNNLSYMQAR